MQKTMTRREFVKLSGVVGGSMLLGVGLFNSAFAYPRVDVQGFFSTQKLHNGLTIPLYGFNADRAIEANAVKSAGKVPIDDGTQVVLEALRAGYKLIETSVNASGYVGDGFVLSQIPRQDVFLSLRLSQNATSDEINADFNEGLAKMKVDYADLVLMEVPQSSQGDVSWLEMAQDMWQALEELYKQNRVRAIGVVGLQSEQFYAFLDSCTIKPMINELNINPFTLNYKNKTFIDTLRHHKIFTSTITPLGISSDSLYDSILQKVAQKHNKTSAQIALRWGLQSGFITLTSANTISQVKEYADIFSFALDMRDMKAISHVHEKKKQ